MRVGTKSVLFGAHCFFIHPFVVAVGWWILYGFPWDLRLWAAFWFHDIGYLRSPNMDGDEGEGHVHLGAKIMGLLFGTYWADFTLRHSRYWAKKHGVTVSKLCYADKLAFVLTLAGCTFQWPEQRVNWPSTWRNRLIGRLAVPRSVRLSARNSNLANQICGFRAFRTTRDAGWNNIETAEPTHGPSSKAAPAERSWIGTE
jgi:hypothetical protein